MTNTWKLVVQLPFFHMVNWLIYADLMVMLNIYNNCSWAHHWWSNFSAGWHSEKSRGAAQDKYWKEKVKTFTSLFIKFYGYEKNIFELYQIVQVSTVSHYNSFKIWSSYLIMPIP